MVSPERLLLKAYGSLWAEISHLRNVVATTASQAHVPSDLYDAAARYCVIQLHDAWAAFNRNAVFISAEGNVLTLSGIKILRSPKVLITEDAEQSLQRLMGPKRWGRFGPAWHDPGQAARAAMMLDAQNKNALITGLGATSTVPTELTACRNFLAHRNPHTATASGIYALRRRLSSPPNRSDTARLPFQRLPDGNTVFEDWCIELDALAAAAIS